MERIRGSGETGEQDKSIRQRIDEMVYRSVVSAALLKETVEYTAGHNSKKPDGVVDGAAIGASLTMFAFFFAYDKTRTEENPFNHEDLRVGILAAGLYGAWLGAMFDGV